MAISLCRADKSIAFQDTLEVNKKKSCMSVATG